MSYNKSRKFNALKTYLSILLIIGIYIGLVTLLIYVEKDSEQSTLTNYPNAIWYSLVTLTTVGYGDIFPATQYGRGITYIFILSSVGLYSFFIGKITNIMSIIKEEKKMGYKGTSFQDHAVIIGWNEFGSRVADQLIDAGKKVAVVTNNPDDIEIVQASYSRNNLYVLLSDFNNFELIGRSNIIKSAITFINLKTDTDKLAYIINLKKVYPNIEFVVTLDNTDLRSLFFAVGVVNIISTLDISSKLLASYMFEPDVASYSEAVLSYAKTDNDHDIKQMLVTSKNPFYGKLYNEVFFDLKKRYNIILMGITKRDKFGNKKLLKNPQGDMHIHAGDYLIMLVTGKSYKVLQNIFGVSEGFIKSEKI